MKSEGKLFSDFFLLRVSPKRQELIDFSVPIFLSNKKQKGNLNKEIAFLYIFYLLDFSVLV